VFTLDTVNDRKFLITTGMSIVAIVAATELEFFHRLLDTVSLTGEQWWICIGAGAVIVLVSEIWKFVLRRRV
jgi:Ca2+-transporting ATPase